MNPHPPIRRSPIAGAWYSDNPHILRNEIKAYIDAATPPALPGEVTGLIAPHAGYFYSGATAGHAYRCVKGRAFDVCVVFSPLHDYLPSQLLTSSHLAYATPLGEVPINQRLVEQCSANIAKATGEILQPIANDREHSLEIQLPFLQVALSAPFSLVPIMVRSQDPALLTAAAAAIAPALKEQNALLVASTDLSHFYTQSEAIQLDTSMLQQISAFSPEGVLRAERCGEGFACGAGAVALMLWTEKELGATRVTLLHHSTSADSSGDASRVVGYGALAVTR
ncbi:MAG TPA: AmmeMemoRadiSam system protein B [Anaerolineaceae bacterium]|nr:AmmeMemoRadiSam system protein B [Anaerolineaceae bacterium]